MKNRCFTVMVPVINTLCQFVCSYWYVISLIHSSFLLLVWFACFSCPLDLLILLRAPHRAGRTTLHEPAEAVRGAVGADEWAPSFVSWFLLSFIQIVIILCNVPSLWLSLLLLNPAHWETTCIRLPIRSTLGFAQFILYAVTRYTSTLSIYHANDLTI